MWSYLSFTSANTSIETKSIWWLLWTVSDVTGRRGGLFWTTALFFLHVVHCCWSTFGWSVRLHLYILPLSCVGVSGPLPLDTDGRNILQCLLSRWPLAQLRSYLIWNTQLFFLSSYLVLDRIISHPIHTFFHHIIYSLVFFGIFMVKFHGLFGY